MSRTFSHHLRTSSHHLTHMPFWRTVLKSILHGRFLSKGVLKIDFFTRPLIDLRHDNNPITFLGPCQTSLMSLFVKNAIGQKLGAIAVVHVISYCFDLFRMVAFSTPEYCHHCKVLLERRVWLLYGNCHNLLGKRSIIFKNVKHKCFCRDFKMKLQHASLVLLI